VPTHPLWRPFETPTPEEIAAARVREHVPERVQVVAPDPAWATSYAVVRAAIVQVLGDRAVSLRHVGSTSVPGLWAKPILDINLIVADSAQEDDYLPELEGIGFDLRVREPAWEEHRCLRLRNPQTNLHVFSPGATEPLRTVAFRDWLASHPDDRDEYAAAKRAAADLGFTDAMLYNNAKAAKVYDLYERIFAADPAHPHDPQPRPQPPTRPLRTC